MAGNELVVTRVPEIVSDVHCTCGLMVEAAKYGAPADVVFPLDHQLLRMPADESLEACRERLGGVAALPPKSRAALTSLIQFADGAKWNWVLCWPNQVWRLG